MRGQRSLSTLKRILSWGADRELWFVVPAVLLASAVLRTVFWGLGLLALVWLLRWGARGHLTRRTPLDGPTLLLLLMAGMTCLITVDHALTFLAVGRLVAGLSLAYSLLNWIKTRAHLAMVGMGLVGMGLLLGVTAPLLMEWQMGKFNLFPLSWHNHVPQVFADVLNPNMVSGALVMLLPFPLAIIFSFIKPRVSPLRYEVVPKFLSRLLNHTPFVFWLSLLSVFVILVSLLLTQSRGGWVAAGVVLGVMLIGYTFAFLGLVPLGAGALGWLTWQGRLQSLLETLSSGGSVSGLAERVEIWSRALYMIRDFPFTGIGANTYPRLVALLYPLFLIAPGKEVPHAHNLFLQVAVDLGFPGLIAFLAVLLIAFGCGVQSVLRYRENCTCNSYAYALEMLTWACLASLSGMLVHGIVDAATWTIGWAAPLPWAVIGLLVALDREIEGQEDRGTRRQGYGNG